MAQNDPIRPSEKNSSAAGGDVAVGSGSSGEIPVPDGSESPTLVDASSTIKVIPFPSIVSGPDAPTLVAPGSGGLSGGVATAPVRTRTSQRLQASFDLVPGTKVAGRYEILAVL